MVNPSHSVMSKSQKSQNSSRNQQRDATVQEEIQQQKKRYKQIIQQQMQNQRKQTKQKVIEKKKAEAKVYKNHLKSEIKKKKKELEVLIDNSSNNQSDMNVKAGQAAQIKSKQDKDTREKAREQSEKNNQMSQIRFKSACVYQKQLKQQVDFKKTQAQKLRKVHIKTEEQERSRAFLYNKTAVLSQIRKQKQNLQYLKYQQNLYKQEIHKHGLNSSKGNRHKREGDELVSTKNRCFVVEQSQEKQQVGIINGQAENLRKTELQKLRVESQQRNRKDAVKRGNSAALELRRQQQYEAYCLQAEQQQKKYNLRRIQAGKSNQFNGVKPMTLAQIDMNKKNRASKDFQESFLKQPEKQQKGLEYAKKYEIIQKKNEDIPKKEAQIKKYPKMQINYEDNESLIPQNSEGHYSFEQSGRRSVKSNQSKGKKKVELRQGNRQNQGTEGMQQIVEQAETSDQKRRMMKQTRASNNQTQHLKKQSQDRHELGYSQSQQQDHNN